MFFLFLLIIELFSLENKPLNKIHLNGIEKWKSPFLANPRHSSYVHLFRLFSFPKTKSELAILFGSNQHYGNYLLLKYLYFRKFRLSLISTFEDPKKKELFDKFFDKELQSLVLIPRIHFRKGWLSGFMLPQKFFEALEKSGLVIGFAFTCIDCVFVADIFGETKRWRELTLMATNVKSFTVNKTVFWIQELVNEAK